jgi:hypothetical protein
MATDYKGLDVITAIGDGGILVIDDFKELADRAGQVYQGTGVPNANDDSAGTAGNGEFNVWSKWHRTTTGDIYFCVDATPTSAEWIRITSDAAGLGSIDGVSNPGGNVDLVEGTNIDIIPNNPMNRIIFNLDTSTDINFDSDNIGTTYGVDDDAKISWNGTDLIILTDTVTAGGVISVLGTTDYETNITHDDDIPNKKYVDDAIAAAVGAAVGAAPTIVQVTSDPYIVQVAQSGYFFTNEGTAILANCRLPAGSTASLQYRFIVQNSNGFRITSQVGDSIRLGDTVTVDAGYIESTAVGSVVDLIAINNSEWMALSVVGPWTVETS